MDLSGIDWVIVGGESGPKARPMGAGICAVDPRPVQGYKRAFFFKQWGGIRPKSGERKWDGREWNQFPKPPYVVAAE
jgi:protein gp37